MSSTIAAPSRSRRRAACLALSALILIAGCGGGDEEATPVPTAQTTPTAPQMLPVVTPTPGIMESPSPAGDTESTPPTANSSSDEGDTYVVEPGDTLGSIAAEFGVTIDALKEANGIEDPNDLIAGLTLVIPNSGN